MGKSIWLGLKLPPIPPRHIPDPFVVLSALEKGVMRLKYRSQGLHWFRRGFGRVAGHVELNVLVKQIQTN